MNRTRRNYVDASTENLCAFPSCSSSLPFTSVGLLADRDERHTRDRSTGLINSTTSQLTDVVIGIALSPREVSRVALRYGLHDEEKCRKINVLRL